MYMHIVMMSFAPSAGSEFFEKVEAYAARIRQECANLNLYHFGPNEAARANGYTLAVDGGWLAR